MLKTSKPKPYKPTAVDQIISVKDNTLRPLLHMGELACVRGGLAGEPGDIVACRAPDGKAILVQFENTFGMPIVGVVVGLMDALAN